ncbi:MAG: YciC family protein [Arsenophonus sp.]|nr:MAG: YciC family protein [Arsenophonus sp.]
MNTNLIINDCINFFKNQKNDIFIFSFITSCISVFFYHFSISNYDFEKMIEILHAAKNINSLLLWINELPKEEKNFLLKISLLSLISIFINMILLFSLIINYLFTLHKNKKIFIFSIFIKSLYQLPKMIILFIICIILIYLGLILFIIPGIFFTIILSFSPIILLEKKNIIPINAIIQSFKISLNNWKNIFPIITIWFLIQLLINLILIKLNLFPHIIHNLISSIINNLLHSFLLIYYFRIYTLKNINYI